MGFSNERMRTGQLVNWFLLDGLELTPAGNPITRPQELPFGVDHLIGFNELLTCKHPENTGVHFFLDDYQFERFWRQPERYVAALARFQCWSSGRTFPCTPTSPPQSSTGTTTAISF